MKYAVGCDPNASELKEILIADMKADGHEVDDFGSDDPIYANVAIKVAILSCPRTILILAPRPSME